MLEQLKKVFAHSEKLVFVSKASDDPLEAEIIYANPFWSRVTGYSYQPGCSLSTILADDADPTTLDRLKKAYHYHTEFEDYLLGEQRDGSYAWWHLNMIPIYEEQSERWLFVYKIRTAEDYELVRDKSRLLEDADLSVEVAKIGYWEWYPGSERAYFSPGMYEILGVDRTEEQGEFETYREAVQQEDQLPLFTDIETDKERVYPIPLHKINRYDSNETRYIRGAARGSLVDGECVKIYGIMKDVTAYEKQVEETRLFKQAIESSNSGFTISDMTQEDNPIIYCNDRFLSMTEYERKEVIGQNCRFLQGSDRQQEQRFELREVVDKGESTRVLLRNYTKEGELFWNQLSVAPITNTKGEITNYVGVQEDVTEEVELQNQLQESERMWRNLVKVNPELIAIIKEGDIIFINKAGANIFGAENPEVIEGRAVMDLVHQDFRDSLAERMEKLDEGESTDFYTYRINSFDERERYLRTRSIPMMISGENAILTVGQDVTTQFMNQSKLRKLNDQKQTLIKEIHHRVKNNMAIVSGLLDLQKEDIDDQEAIDALSDSQLRLQSMAQVHEQLYKEEDLTDIPTDEYIQDLLDTISDSYEDLDVEIKTNIDSMLLNVNQAIPLGLLLNELIANAFSHAFEDKEGGTIGVDLHHDDGTVEVVVRDDGKGLPVDFDPQQPESLGYTIIQTLATQIGAELSFETSEEGTVVHFSFERGKLRGSSSNIENEMQK